MEHQSAIRLPEVRIPLPEAVVYCLEKCQSALTLAHSWVIEAAQKISIPPELLAHIKSNGLLLLGVSIIFSPLLLSLLTAFTVFGTWIFWLFTTSIFGLLQLVYVIYQFLMIAVDILSLSLLKTYTMLRTRVLNYLGKSGTWDRRRNRRLVWRERLEAASSYEDYLKIPIEACEVKRQEPRRQKSDPAIMRSNSIGDLGLHDSPSKQLTRNRSFTSLVTAVSEQTDQQVPLEAEVVEELGEMAAVMLMTTKHRLKEARLTATKHEEDIEACSTLKQLLSGVVKRNHLNVDNFLIQNARRIASSGQYGLSSRSRKLIHDYFEEVEKGLDWIAEAPLPEGNVSPNSKSILEIDETPEGIDTAEFAKLRQRTTELNDRITLIRRIKANVGRTSLMLSGGGAQAMYHLGTLRALIEGGVYHDIKVISGTSGGSIAAAMCALKTPEELHRDVCVPTVSTDYLLTGEQKKKNIRWFPTVRSFSRLKISLLVSSNDWFLTSNVFRYPMSQVTDMAKTWLKTKLMVDSAVSSLLY